jgi:hypothetical protein
MIRTFRAMNRVEPGFTRPRDILTMGLGIPEAVVKDAAEVARTEQGILRKLAEIPEVTAASLTSSMTMDGNHNDNPIFAEDRAYVEGIMPDLHRFKFIAPGFFQMQQAVWSVNPNLPLVNPRTLEEIVRKSMARTSLTLVMLALAGGMALLLGLEGIYGVISYSVWQRRREIGIRMALGAQEQMVTRMFLGHGLALAGIGVVAGLAASIGLMRLLASLLFDVSPVDPLTYASVSAAVAAAALAASYLPSRRALRVDPAEALRAE